MASTAIQKLSCAFENAAAPTIGKAQALAMRPKPKRTVDTWSNESRRLSSRPNTVPMPQSAAATSVSTIGVSPWACGSSGCGSAISQTPASAGSRNQAKPRRGCSLSTSHAPRTAISGCTFCRTTTVMKSPCKSALVKRIVAIAEAPAPTATPGGHV